MLIFNRKKPNLYMCSIQMSLKYILDIGLIASSLENRHVGLIQSRVREGAQKGVNEVYFIKTCFWTLELISLQKPDSYCYIYQVK